MTYSGYYVLDAEGDGLDRGAGALPEDVKEVWCVCFKDIETKETFHFDKFTGWEGLIQTIQEAKMLVCHNILDYDLPVFKRLLGAEPSPECIIVDSLVWSRALYPDRTLEGGHGLEPWGKRNGLPKPPIEDWTQYTPEMLNRCEQDVENNYLTFLKLSQEASMYDSGKFLWLEQQIASIISKQSKRGHAFDKDLAEALSVNLESKLEEIDKELSQAMPCRPCLLNQPVKQVRTKKGEYTKAVLEWFGEELEESYKHGPLPPQKAFSIESGLCQTKEDPAFCRVEWPSPNFGSNNQMIEQLKAQGWQPVEFTDKGNPKISDESFLIEENKHLEAIGKHVIKRRQLASRFGMVKGWLENLSADGRIRGYVNPQGAVTLRMTHKIVVNVPKFKGSEEWSQYYRACFRSSDIPEGERDHDLEWEYDRPTFNEDEEGEMIFEKAKVKGRMAMIGCDAAGLENRMIAHFLNNDELTEKILKDFHTLIWKAVDYYLDSRGATKNWEYAYFFGAADLKLGTMLDKVDEVTEEEALEEGFFPISRGKNKGLWKGTSGGPIPWRLVKYAVNGARSRAMMEKEIPEMGDLVEDVQKEAQQGYLTLFDGRRLIMRRGFDGAVMQHKAMNTRIQGAGALVMKAASVLFDRWIKKEGLEVYFLNHIHDEIQVECYPSDRFRVATLLRQSIIRAGEIYDLNLALDGESKIGLNWAETH